MDIMKINYGEFVRSHFKQDTLPQMYLHAAVGIVGEAIELAEAPELDDCVEELGDVAFYIQAMFNLRQRQLAEFHEVPRECGQTVLQQAGEILDVVKRYAIYGLPLDEPRLDAALTIVAACFFAKLRVFGVTWEFVREHNVRKLQKRYASGAFSTAEAEARADKSTVQ